MDCGTTIDPQWLPFTTPAGWWIASRCGPCAEKADVGRRAERKAEQRRVAFDERLRRARLTAGRRTKSFDTFQMRPGVEHALIQAQSFADRMGRREARRGLLLVGPNGTGKTHLATAILNAVLDTGLSITGIFIEFADYLEALRQSFSASSTVHPEWLRYSMFEVDLLVLDDLGAARHSTGTWNCEELVRLLNRRIEEGRPVIITTDLGRDELVEHLDDRVASRLYEACEIARIEDETEDFRRDMS